MTSGASGRPRAAASCSGEMKCDAVSTLKLQGEAASAWTGHRLSVKTREAVFPIGECYNKTAGCASAALDLEDCRAGQRIRQETHLASFLQAVRVQDRQPVPGRQHLEVLVGADPDV